MIECIEISTCETRSNKFWKWSAIGNFSTAPIQFMGVLDFQMETWSRAPEEHWSFLINGFKNKKLDVFEKFALEKADQSWDLSGTSGAPIPDKFSWLCHTFRKQCMIFCVTAHFSYLMHNFTVQFCKKKSAHVETNSENQWFSWVWLQAIAKQITYDVKGILKTVLDQNSNKLTRLSLFISLFPSSCLHY